ncbi:MAG: hypothetical protein K2L07_13695 [Lachnospiraceae bacterium]|nr:hypothetical protein [Lachnospiraceae bacterium]
MIKEDTFIRERMEQEYPKTTKAFRDMVKTKISEQLGADGIESAGTKEPDEKKPQLWQPLKWVAAAAIVLVCGTTAAAAVNPELRQYLLEHLALEDVDSYMQNVDPEVNEEGSDRWGNDKPLEITDMSLENPLWTIDNAWYDGVTLYFSASPSEEAQRMKDIYEMNPSDHCMVNGKDNMLECSDAERSEEYPSIGEVTGQYHFRVVLGEYEEFLGDINVSFNLYIRKRNSTETAFTTQEIQFHVDSTDAPIKVAAEEYKNQELPGGKAEILQLKLAPSALYAEVKYTFYGTDAKEKAEKLAFIRYYIEDSQGNRLDGQYYADLYYEGIQGNGDVVEESDGSYSVLCKWQKEGVNADSEGLTFLPYMTTRDADGKDIPDSEEILEWAVLTVPLVTVE